MEQTRKCIETLLKSAAGLALAYGVAVLMLSLEKAS